MGLDILKSIPGGATQAGWHVEAVARTVTIHYILPLRFQSLLIDIQADNSHGKDLNTEHVLALNPGVLILPTSNGYHPPRELYDTPDFKHLSMLKAVRERRIYALPWSPCNCDQRLEYPINVMVMAKAAYPQLFADIKLEGWMISFFRNVYHVDDKTANRLIDVLWMGWARDQ